MKSGSHKKNVAYSEKGTPSVPFFFGASHKIV